MPDDMLEDAIAVAGKALSDYDFESQGVEVRFPYHNACLDCENCEETHG